jgi:hypothetical protein
MTELTEFDDWQLWEVEVLRPDQAEELVAEVVTWLGEYPADAVIGLYAGRAWIALGYPDWESLCADRFGDVLRLPRPGRQEVVAHLRAYGLSTRAIASAVGVDDKTVRRDLDSAAANAAPALPGRVAGLDGKSYASTRPQIEDDTPRPTPAPPQPALVLYQPPTHVTDAIAAGRPVVVSLRDQDLRDWATDANVLLRIDRTSKWGNPFVLPEDGTRDDVIAAYRDHYLPNKPSLIAALDELSGKALGCWCAPDPCHGDVLIQAWAQR